MSAPVLRTLIALLLAVLVAYLVQAALGSTLYAPAYLTGWALTGLVVYFASAWWRAPRELDEVARKLRGQVGLSLVVLAGFLIHTDFSLPRGAIETALFALTIAVGASLVAGTSLVFQEDERRRGRDDGLRVWRRANREQRVARWLRLHTGLVGGLLGLGVFHGLFLHFHGLLAHLVLYRGEGS